MSGGILPTTIHNNKIYFLFGKENRFADTPGWSDFGGGAEDGEDFMKTAIREAEEETTGFLGDEKDIKQMLKKYGTYNITNNKYRMHIFPIVYDSHLPFYYNNNQRFLQKRLDPDVIKNSKIFEKEEIRWICADELKKYKPKFRSYFQNTMEIMLKEQDAIESFIRKSLSGKSSKKSSKKSVKRIKSKGRKTMRRPT